MRRRNRQTGGARRVLHRLEFGQVFSHDWVSVCKKEQEILCQGILYVIHFQVLIKVFPDIGTVILLGVVTEHGLVIKPVQGIEKYRTPFLFLFSCALLCAEALQVLLVTGAKDEYDCQEES